MDYYSFDHKIEKDDLEDFQYPNRKIGVIVHIVDETSKILLQQRGVKSRDENGLYEDVGGRVEETDLDYNFAIIREMREEMGDEAQFQLSDSIGIYHLEKKNINWVFVIFYAKYLGGKIKIMEPDKCTDYKFFDYNEVIDSDLVSEGCKYLTRCIKKWHNY